ncbi:MAG TPA: hypothetical protein VG097_10515 [Gemmata sp.]|jgi:hypothetical protein|nr:hypothetical protein [Gemmata sp.]
MPPHQPINLIRLFDFYLALMFLISFLRRWDVYVNAVRILFAVRGRWPKLIQRLGEHKSILLNWSFFRPAILALFVTLIQLVASRMVWPYAVLTGPELHEEWWLIPIIFLPLIPMLAVDIYFIVRVARFDHSETVKYFDKAENWLGWKGPLIRWATFGIVNPHKMVDEELKKSLTEYRSTLNASLWWVIAQTSLRIVFGLTLWTVWAIRG